MQADPCVFVSADLNLPISGVAAVAVLIFLKLPTPPGTFAEKIAKLDWMYVPTI